MTNFFQRLMTVRSRRKARKARTVGEHMVWNKQPFFVSAQEKYGAIKGVKDLRLFFLQSAIRSIEDLEGDVAECGSRNGKSALFMLEAMRKERRMYLFDSFEGLSDPTPGKDSLETAIDERTGKRRFHNADPQAVADRFKGHDVHIMQGWIPDRFPEVASRKFCLVHVDVDLFQPTHDSLVFFYDRIVPNGLLICDDYGSGKYPGARQAMDEFFADRPENILELPMGQAFIVKR